MSIEQENIVTPSEDDLDSFSADFFGQEKADTEPASSEDIEDVEDAADDAPVNEEDEDTQSEDDTLDTEEEDEPEEVEEEAPKPKKNRFQERIDELNGKYREEERQRKMLEARIEELTNKLNKGPEPTPTPENGASQLKEPSADDKNEDGSDKYPLGEYDPNLARDLAKFTIQKELEEHDRRQKEEAQKAELSRAQAELQVKWQEKLEPARERYPDFVEKGMELEDTFSDIDPSYGEYLTTTLMEMEHGPDVLYYLANNVDEAKRIVQSGARKATIALGRLEAKFAEAEAEKQLARPKVSKAPPPPKHLNKGSAVARPAIKGDEDDLDSFSSAFFKKR